jgi:hypothetical protein
MVTEQDRNIVSDDPTVGGFELTQRGNKKWDIISKIPSLAGKVAIVTGAKYDS